MHNSTYLGFGHLLGATEDPVHSKGLCKEWGEDQSEGNGCQPDVQLQMWTGKRKQHGGGREGRWGEREGGGGER